MMKPPAPSPLDPAAAAAAAAAAAPTATEPPAPAVEPPAPAARGPMTLADAGIVPAWMDRGVDPCVDFYAYACGGFLKTADIPPDRSSWGAIQIVVKDNEELLHQLLEAAAAPARRAADPITDKLGTYYAACMDEAAVERAGLAPIRPLLDLAAAVTDAKTAARAVIGLHAAAVNPFFALGPQQDFADATQVIAAIDQAGLGLPDRKYYLENDDSLRQTRQVYTGHIERMFALAGRAPTEARAGAANVMAIETALARLQQDEVVRRDPHKVYHRIDRAGLERRVAPTFPWGDYLAALGLPNVTAITVNDPTYYAAVARLLQTERPAALRDYLTWTVLRGSAEMLGRAWVAEAHTMARELEGLKEQPARWRRCVGRVDADLGELLGRGYVAARFAGDSKARAVELTRAVFDAMRAELDALPWMDGATRDAAKHKLDKMAYLVGFPDAWRDYDFALQRDDFAGNVRTAVRWEQARQLAKIGRPVDRFDWQMTPPTVNAYYDVTLNEVALPAGQLQPPFFGARFHPAVNFGSTGGGTIGHEITHGFDDEGSQFDGNGNLRDWWSKATKQRFAEATKCVVDQYGAYEAVPKVRLNGKLTAGENIADNGGVKIAYLAYQAWRAGQAAPPPREVEGLTDDQLYFLAYGQSWCDKATPEQLKTMAHSNPHSPPRWRVNGVIVNQPGFGAAFQCKAGAPMVPEKQCSVW
jgi:predicted metalloendopeptidase